MWEKIVPNKQKNKTKKEKKKKKERNFFGTEWKMQMQYLFHFRRIHITSLSIVLTWNFETKEPKHNFYKELHSQKPKHWIFPIFHQRKVRNLQSRHKILTNNFIGTFRACYTQSAFYRFFFYLRSELHI